MRGRVSSHSPQISANQRARRGDLSPGKWSSLQGNTGDGGGGRGVYNTHSGFVSARSTLCCLPISASLDGPSRPCSRRQPMSSPCPGGGGEDEQLGSGNHGTGFVDTAVSKASHRIEAFARVHAGHPGGRRSRTAPSHSTLIFALGYLLLHRHLFHARTGGGTLAREVFPASGQKVPSV